MSLKNAIVTAIVFLAGCTSTAIVDYKQATIAPDSSVVAFSVNTGKLLQYDPSIRPVELEIYFAGEWTAFPLTNQKDGIQRFLLEIPDQAVSFSRLELQTGAGLFSDFFVTDGPQRVEVTMGEITYLGRLVITDIEFEKRADGSFGQPDAVQLVFADAFESDQAAWEQQYALFQNKVPDQLVVGHWAGKDYVNVSPKSWNRSTSHSFTMEHGGGNARVPRMGSSRESAPSKR